MFSNVDLNTLSTDALKRLRKEVDAEISSRREARKRELADAFIAAFHALRDEDVIIRYEDECYNESIYLEDFQNFYFD